MERSELFERQTSSREHMRSDEGGKRNIVAIYLGGGRLPNGQYKALLEIEGEFTAERILSALGEVTAVKRVVAIVHEKEKIQDKLIQYRKPITFLDAAESFIDNAELALGSVEEGEDSLVLFSDIPFVQVDALIRFLASTSGTEVAIPMIFERDVRKIRQFHNLHFYPSSSGHFQLGNAAFIPSSVKERASIDNLARFYKNKSFRQDLIGKFRMAYELVGFSGLLCALRVYVSANLQHNRLKRLDAHLPAFSLESYEKLLTRIFGTRCVFVYGPYESLFLDIDYPEDLDLLNKNISEIKKFMESNKE